MLLYSDIKMCIYALQMAKEWRRGGKIGGLGGLDKACKNKINPIELKRLADAGEVHLFSKF